MTAATTAARPARRRSIETHRTAFEVHADDRWWFLVGHVTPARYQWRSTRTLVERYGALEHAPKPGGMRPETYERLMDKPLGQQMLRCLYWLSVLPG